MPQAKHNVMGYPIAHPIGDPIHTPYGVAIADTEKEQDQERRSRATPKPDEAEPQRAGRFTGRPQRTCKPPAHAHSASSGALYPLTVPLFWHT